MTACWQHFRESPYVSQTMWRAGGIEGILTIFALILHHLYHFFFFADVSLSLHLDSVMRLNEWQTRINRCSKYSKYNKYPKEKTNPSLVRLKKEKQASSLDHKRKIHKHATELLSASEFLEFLLKFF